MNTTTHIPHNIDAASVFELGEALRPYIDETNETIFDNEITTDDEEAGHLARVYLKTVEEGTAIRLRDLAPDVLKAVMDDAAISVLEAFRDVESDNHDEVLAFFWDKGLQDATHLVDFHCAELQDAAA